jgi:5-methyltetrahydrofolate--homocysteine methyltransferase
METALSAIFDAVLTGRAKDAEVAIDKALAAGVPVERILNAGLIAAMDEVGARFERGEFYVPEMLVAARAMHAGLPRLKPLLVAQGVGSAGKAVIGTVKGDLHDIGKNLVCMMLEGAGFEIIDLGFDISPEQFAMAVSEHRPDLVGMSALLSTTMWNMQRTIRTLDDRGLRTEVKVMVGGAAVTPEFATQIGADGYAADASRAVALAKSLLAG